MTKHALQFNFNASNNKVEYEALNARLNIDWLPDMYKVNIMLETRQLFSTYKSSRSFPRVSKPLKFNRYQGQRMLEQMHSQGWPLWITVNSTRKSLSSAWKSLPLRSSLQSSKSTPTKMDGVSHIYRNSGALLTNPKKAWKFKLQAL